MLLEDELLDFVLQVLKGLLLTLKGEDDGLRDNLVPLIALLLVFGVVVVPEDDPI